MLGRRVLFLARRAGEDTRDVWRARARVSPEGDVLEVLDAHDLTSTPLGDDHALVVRGDHAAFATRAYGQEQSVTALDLAGEGRAEQGREARRSRDGRAHQPAADGRARRARPGRRHARVAGARRVGLALGDETLAISLYDRRLAHARRRARRRSTSRRASSRAPVPGLRADASMHLPKRFSHWAVDTLRAVPWIGPAPIAWLEDQALAARDTLPAAHVPRDGGDATDVVATADPPPPVLDTSQASVEEAHWPPPRIPTHLEGGRSRARATGRRPTSRGSARCPASTADAPSAFYRTFVRPDDERPYAKVLLVAMDLRQLDLDMEAGVEDPEPLTGSARHRPHPARPRRSTGASRPRSTAPSRPSTATTG